MRTEDEEGQKDEGKHSWNTGAIIDNIFELEGDSICISCFWWNWEILELAEMLFVQPFLIGRIKTLKSLQKAFLSSFY